MTEYVIGLGANLGSRRATIRAALALLSGVPGIELGASSAPYESEAVGPAQPRFLNAAVRLATDLPPGELLDVLQRVEAELGRERRERWGPRTLDLDVLWSARPVAEPRLTVPHRRLEQRWFALAPLLDVLPELAPIYGPVLRRLGGPDGEPVSPPRREVEPLGDGRERLTVEAADPSDRLAALLGLLASRLADAPAPAAPTLRAVRLAAAGGPEALAAPAVEALAEAAAAGFGVSEVTLGALDAGAATLYLVGAPAPAARVELGPLSPGGGRRGALATLVIRRRISDS